MLAVFDKPDPLDGPFFEETIYVTPSRQPAPILASLAATVVAAAAAAGLREGPVHAELRVGADGRLVVIEVAARSIGGLCARALRFGAGVSLEEIIVRHAVGAGLDGLRRETQASGVMMLPIRAAGMLEKVSGQAEALAVDGVVGLEITISAGRAVVPLPEGDRYLGFVFARGPTPADVELALRRAEAALDVVVSPSSLSGGGVRRPGPPAPGVGSAGERFGGVHLRVGPPTVVRCDQYRLPARRWPPGALCRRGSGHAVRRTMSTGPNGLPCRCRCTRPCAWPCGWPTPCGPAGPACPCASSVCTPAWPET